MTSVSRRNRPPRYVVASFTIEQEQHDWLSQEAIRLTTQTQTRVSMSDIIRAVLVSMMEQGKPQSNVHSNP
jgi:hypothetical protein